MELARAVVAFQQRIARGAALAPPGAPPPTEPGQSGSEQTGEA
jgi:hypothetical protein